MKLRIGNTYKDGAAFMAVLIASIAVSFAMLYGLLVSTGNWHW